MPYLVGRVARVNAKSAFVTLPRTADLGLPRADGLLRASKDKLDRLERGAEVKVSVVRIDQVRSAGGNTIARAILRFATQCHYCKHFGHSARECRQLIAVEQARESGKRGLSRNQRRRQAREVDLKEVRAQRAAKRKVELKAPAAPLMSAFVFAKAGAAAAAPAPAAPVAAAAARLDTCCMESFPALPAKAGAHAGEPEAEAMPEIEIEAAFETEIEVEAGGAWCPIEHVAEAVAEVALTSSSSPTPSSTPSSTSDGGGSSTVSDVGGKRKRLSKKRRERARRQQAEAAVKAVAKPVAAKFDAGLVDQIRAAESDARAAQARLSLLLEKAQLVSSQSA